MDRMIKIQPSMKIAARASLYFTLPVPSVQGESQNRRVEVNSRAILTLFVLKLQPCKCASIIPSNLGKRCAEASATSEEIFHELLKAPT